jgi:hypothetical protein
VIGFPDSGPSQIIETEALGALSAGLDPATAILGTNVALLDFWVWAHSDVLSNDQRSVLGEYLVALAVRQTMRPRVQWDNVDVRAGGVGIEVKTTSAHQAWLLGPGSKSSPPRFDIARRVADVSVSGSRTPTRAAQVYVFCFYAGPAAECRTNLDRRLAVLDVGQWEFWVVPTSTIDRLGGQKSIGLTSLRRLVPSVTYVKLGTEIVASIDAL